MQLIDGKLILSASDLTNFLACEHLTQLELATMRGEYDRPEGISPEVEVLTRRGMDHEERYLEGLRSQGYSIVEIKTGPGFDGLYAAAKATIESMRRGVDIVYQGTFFDGGWIGHPDFLRRVALPSDLGPFSYEVEDTKLARRVKASALLQVCVYSDFLTHIQGRAPEKIHITLGDMTRKPFLYKDFAAYFRTVKSQIEDTVFRSSISTYPHPVEHCKVCRWSEVCERRLREDDHLSLVAGMGRDQTKKLMAAGIRTFLISPPLHQELPFRGWGEVRWRGCAIKPVCKWPSEKQG
jgi:predicted RecB family nuclease